MAKAGAGAAPAREAGTIQVEFTLAKQTKNALRYQEDGTDGDNRGKIGTLYVQKTALPSSPAHITVTISE